MHTWLLLRRNGKPAKRRYRPASKVADCLVGPHLGYSPSEGPPTYICAEVGVYEDSDLLQHEFAEVRRFEAGDVDAVEAEFNRFLLELSTVN